MVFFGPTRAQNKSFGATGSEYGEKENAKKELSASPPVTP
jgi:hypothetical protein